MSRKLNETNAEPRRRFRPFFFIGTLLCLGATMLFFVITAPRRRRISHDA